MIIIFFLILIMFIAWHFIPECKPSNPKLTFRHEPRAIANDPNWQTFIKQHCESPAETAFLEAMIVAHELLPDNSSLRTNELKLDFQVSVDRYRLDFLANDWLIIEIDGAAWHSSEEAKARDAKRDKFFIGLGYSVIRIPAKIVFNNPDEAVQRVDAALRIGKPVIAQSVQKTGLERLRQTASSTRKFITDLDTAVSLNKQVADALRPAEMAYQAEKTVIDAAIIKANRQIFIENAFKGDNERRVAFEDRIQKFNILDDNHKIDVPEYINPDLSGIQNVDLLIYKRFSDLSKDRDDYLHEIRNDLIKNTRLIHLVRENLIKSGNQKLWKNIGIKSTVESLFNTPVEGEKIGLSALFLPINLEK